MYFLKTLFIFLYINIIFLPFLWADQEPKPLLLSVTQAVDMALERNIDIKIAQADRDIAQMAVGVYDADYDPALSASFGYRDDQTEPVSSVFGSKSLERDASIGVSKKFMTGTDVSADAASDRNWNNSFFSTQPLTHDSSVGISVTQSLGKNRFGSLDRKGRQVAKLNAESVEQSALDRVDQVVAAVELAYWDVQWNRERLTFQADMTQQARELLDFHEEKFKDGLVEEPELIAARANYHQRMKELNLLENHIRTSESRLKFYLDLSPEDRLELTDRPEILDVELSWNDYLQDAFLYRKDYLAMKHRLQARQLTLAMKENSLWPEIDLTASLRQNGVEDSLDASVEEVSSDDHREAFVGVTVEYPLGNRKARYEKRAAELENSRMLWDIKRLENDIRIEIEDALRTVTVLADYARDSQDVFGLQRQKYESEKKRFDNGRSSLDALIRYQEDEIQAQQSAVRAKYDYCAALIDLRRKSGVMLDETVLKENP